MANISGANLQPIYERLNNAPSYHPLEADTFADWAIEAGDIVTITRDDNSYQSPVQNSVIKWQKGQKVSLSSTGSKEREPVAKMSRKKYGSGGSALRNSEYQHIYAVDQYEQLRAGLELTTSTALLYVDNKYTQMQSGLSMASSSAKLYVDNRYTQMQSGLALTESSAKLYVDNRYTQMASGLALSESSAKLYVDNKYTQMVSGLALTESSAKLYVDNRYTQMQSGLALTESSAKLYVDNRYTQMASGLALSESSAKLYVDNKYTQMVSGLALTESSAKLYVDNRYTQMQSGLALTESSAKLYVDNRYTEMQSGLSMTASSAKLYVDNKTTRAQILLAINGGESSAKIKADNIELDGHTIATALDGEDVNFTNCYAEYANVDMLLINNVGIDDHILEEIHPIVDASVSGDTLTLTKADGTTIDFRKATTPTLSDSWISGTTNSMNVTSSPSPTRSFTYSFPIINSATLGRYVDVNRSGDQGQTLKIGRIDVSSVYDSGRDAGETSGKQTGIQSTTITYGASTATASATLAYNTTYMFTPRGTVGSTTYYGTNLVLKTPADRYSDGQKSATLTASGWSNGTNKVTNDYNSDKFVNVSVPSIDSYGTITLASSDIGSSVSKTCTATLGGTTRSHALTINASAVYSAGQSSGWTAAYGKVSLPGSNTSSASFTVKTPSSTYGNQTSTTYTGSLQSASGSAPYVDVKNPSGTTIARVDVTSARSNGLASGWSLAYSKVSFPGLNTSSNNFTVYAPSNTYGNQTSTKYTGSLAGEASATPYVDIKNPSGTTVARVDATAARSNGLVDGWGAYYDATSWARPTLESPTVRVPRRNVYGDTTGEDWFTLVARTGTYRKFNHTLSGPLYGSRYNPETHRYEETHSIVLASGNTAYYGVADSVSDFLSYVPT